MPAYAAEMRLLHGLARRPCTVLVVDDERDYVDTLALLLQASGYQVLTASNGDLALQALRSHRVDVVLTDLAMPQLDGFRLLEAIRAEPAGAGALVMAVSGWGGRDTHARCASAGFDAFFVKPCDVRDLLWTIAAGVARQSGAADPVSSGSVLL